MTGVLVEYALIASSPPHHHTAKGSVVAYVLEGAIHSKVNNGPEGSTPPARAGSSRRAGESLTY
jgi:quercetin dioxygenase-like cupin family protein